LKEKQLEFHAMNVDHVMQINVLPTNSANKTVQRNAKKNCVNHAAKMDARENFANSNVHVERFSHVKRTVVLSRIAFSTKSAERNVEIHVQ
jgi:hypothetical protein